MVNRKLILIILFFLNIVIAKVNEDSSEINFNPKPFLPEIFDGTSYRLHGYPTFDDESNTIFWSVIPPKVMFARQIDGQWSVPTIAEFSQGNIQAPHYKSDQKRMYFQLTHSAGFGSLDIWYVEKTDSGWTSIHNPGCPPNSSELESQPSLTKNGNLYFTGKYEIGGLQRGIYVSKFINGQYCEPLLLPEQINTQYIDYMPFISPDEDFLLFTSSRPVMSEQSIRIFVSFRGKDGIWSEPVNLNELMNFDQPSRFPCLTPENQVIIFLSDNRYWQVPIEIINVARKMVRP